MKRFALALALACAFSGTVLAGNMPSTDITAPQPDIPGHVPTSDVADPTAPDALTMLLSIISAVV